MSYSYSGDRSLKVQVAEIMRNLIIAGEWKQGESVGDVMKLADRFGVSFGTVRAAEEILVEEGWLMPIRPGIPTRVAVRSEPSVRELAAELADIRDRLTSTLARLEKLAS